MNIFSLRSKMKQTFRNFCVGQTSTSTLDQNQLPPPAATLFTFHDLHPSVTAAPAPSSFATAASTTTTSSYNDKSSPSHEYSHTYSPINNPPRHSVTLEEMILQLELEEELARRAKLLDEHRCRRQQLRRGGASPEDNDMFVQQHRMSCVNSSDILRSARHALNQYHPRFSLDGKDAMYRSSFRNDDDDDDQNRDRQQQYRLDMRLGKLLPTVTTEKRRVSVGEKVVWCKPGVVAKLMGLDALPVPLRKMTTTTTATNNKSRNRGRGYRHGNCRREEQAGMRNENLRRRVQRSEVERRRKQFMMDDHDVMNKKLCDDVCYGTNNNKSSGYCMMKQPPVSSEISTSSFEQAAARDGLVRWRRSNVNSRPPFL